MNGPLNVFVAFAAGVVSFLSPCVLPLIPGYIAMISGLSLHELTGTVDRAAIVKKALAHSALFVLGFSAVFTVLGAFATGIGSPLGAFMPFLKKVAGTIIVVSGLHIIGILPIKWLYYQKSAFPSEPGPRRAGGAFALGATFAFGWTPCVGPVLAAMLALAAEQHGISRGMLLLFVYSLGIGVPFLFTAAGVGSFLWLFQRYKKFIRWSEVAAGGLLILVGILMFLDRFTALSEFFSIFNRFVL